VPVPVYAVIPSYGRDCLLDCLDSLADQVDAIFLVQTREFAIRSHPKLICLWPDASRGLNISEWWNMGIAAAAKMAAGHPGWDVLVANDDVVAAPGAVAALSGPLRETAASLACPPRPEHAAAWSSPQLLGEEGQHGLISGWFFLLRGEEGLLADSRLRWWYGDNDLEQQARRKGGMVVVPACRVVNRFPGGHDHLMAAEIARDREIFTQKWSGEVAR
jgi:hypothetical protein